MYRVALSFCTPVLLELFLCMHPQSPAIVSQLLLHLFRHSLSYLPCNFSENCALMAGCCNLIISNFFLIALFFCFLFSFSLIFDRTTWWSLAMSAPLMVLATLLMSGVACTLTSCLLDSLSFLLEKSMSVYISVYVEKWYLLPQGY